MDIILAASSDETAETLGALLGRVGILAVGIWLLASGLKQRKTSQGTKGTGRVVGGSILLALVVLGTLGSIAQQS